MKDPPFDEFFPHNTQITTCTPCGCYSSWLLGRTALLQSRVPRCYRAAYRDRVNCTPLRADCPLLRADYTLYVTIVPQPCTEQHSLAVYRASHTYTHHRHRHSDTDTYTHRHLHTTTPTHTDTDPHKHTPTQIRTDTYTHRHRHTPICQVRCVCGLCV